MKVDRKELRRARRHARKLVSILTALLTPPVEQQPEPEPTLGNVGIGVTEAEILILASGYVVEEVDHPEFASGKVIRTIGPGTAIGDFTGPAGRYLVEVAYFDESDGQALFDLWIDGKKVLSWTADADDDALHRAKVEVDLEPGDLITIRVTPNAGEPARIDRIIVSEVDEREPTEPVEEEPEPVPSDFIVVTNSAELKSALAISKGGDAIRLKGGVYGNLSLSGLAFAEPVSIFGSDAEAEFDEIVMTDCAGLVWSGIAVDAFRAYSSKQIALTGSEVDGIVYMKDIDGLSVAGNDVAGNFHAMLLNDVRDFVVKGNKIHGAQEDLMRITGNSHGGEVSENFFFDTRPKDYRNDGDSTTEGYNHSDFLQMFGANGYTPHDITIRRNLMFDDRATGDKSVTPQGIFISDPQKGGFKDLLIEENLIAVNSVNSIVINGGQESVVVLNNSLIPLNGGGAIIRVRNIARMDNSGTIITGNACKEISNDDGSSPTISGNYVYGRGADISALFAGIGSRWQDYVPVPGSELEASGKGAKVFLAELAAGKVPAALQ